jgi:hypothetical protein
MGSAALRLAAYLVDLVLIQEGLANPEASDRSGRLTRM